MYETYGNVAYSLPKKVINTMRTEEQNRQFRKRHRADPKRIALKVQSEEERIESLYHRQMARQRISRIFACVFAVSLVTASFVGILYRNSRILELNYANVRLEKEIAQIEKEQNQIKEELSKKTDLNTIRALAIERLGMQDPAQKQIILVSIPTGDRLIMGSDCGDTNNGDTQLSSALTNIEGFFKTIR